MVIFTVFAAQIHERTSFNGNVNLSEQQWNTATTVQGTFYTEQHAYMHRVWLITQLVLHNITENGIHEEIMLTEAWFVNGFLWCRITLSRLYLQYNLTGLIHNVVKFTLLRGLYS